jgi:hypothetical protein
MAVMVVPVLQMILLLHLQPQLVVLVAVVVMRLSGGHQVGQQMVFQFGEEEKMFLVEDETAAEGKAAAEAAAEAVLAATAFQVTFRFRLAVTAGLVIIFYLVEAIGKFAVVVAVVVIQLHQDQE